MGKSKGIYPNDLRQSEFQHAALDDLEYCSVTGKVVRKDRWDQLIRSLRYRINGLPTEWEVSDVVMEVRVMKYGTIARAICAPMPKPVRLKFGQVAEEDLWKDEFQGCRIEDLEERSNGTFARKDRWEMGVREIAHILGISSPNFEMSEVEQLFEELLQKTERLKKCSRRESNSGDDGFNDE